MIREVRIPRIDSNEDYVRLAEWYVEDGERVKKGDSICSIETSKSITDLTAEESGYIKIVAQEVEELKIQEVIAYIVDDLAEKIPLKKEKKETVRSELETDYHTEIKKEIDKREKATKKARELAKELGIDLEKIEGKRIIRERDVQDFFKQIKQYSEKEGRVTDEQKKDAGRLNKEFIEFLRKDFNNEKNFGKLSSEFKTFLYRQNGAKIGNNSKIGKDSYIIATNISLGNNSVIGEKCIFNCEIFEVGEMASFGDEITISCREFLANDLLTCRNSVVVADSTEKGLDSRLNIGKACFIGSKTYINTEKEVVLKDHVCLSPRVMLLTHRQWQSALEGYSVSFEGVLIGSHVWIGCDAQVLPGTSIGNRSTIMGNSIVAMNVEEDCFVGGIPAKKIVSKQSYRKKLSIDEKDSIMHGILNDFMYTLEGKGYDISKQKRDDYFLAELKFKKNKANILYSKSIEKTMMTGIKGRLIILTFNKNNITISKELTIFNLQKSIFHGKRDIFSDEMREFLRQRGIKFRPILWRYKYGL